jgi:hypothetical protein
MSADGEHYAYVARNPANPQQSALIVDGKPAGYAGAGPMFTANGLHLYTLAPPASGRPGQEVLLDGKPWVRANGIQIYMPPVGDRVVAVVSAGVPGTPNAQFLHVDGKKVPGSDCAFLRKVQFSPDGKHYAAECETPARSHVMIVDGKRGRDYERQFSYIGFTPDSSRAVYIAQSGSNQFLVIGDQESNGYESIGDMSDAFRPRVVVDGGGKRVAFKAKGPNNACVVVADGKATPLGGRSYCANDLAFSPDGSRYAYVGELKPLAKTLVVDGVEQTGTQVLTFDGPASGKPEGSPPITFMFSPDSKHIVHFATMAAQSNAYGIAIDDKYIPLTVPFPPRFPVFTPNGKHFVFAAAAGPLLPLVVYVDGRPAARFESGALKFQISNDRQNSIWEMGADGVLTFLVQDGADIKRVRVSPSDDTSVDTMIAEARPIPGVKRQ